MILKVLLLAPVFLTILEPTSSSKILAIIPTPSYSHQLAYRNIWVELSKRGHQVTVLTTNPVRDPILVNLTEIDLSATYNIMDKFYEIIQNVSSFEAMRILIKMGDAFLEFQMNQEPVKALMQNKSLFDVVICESFYYEFQAFADLYKCPKILISSLDVFNVIYGVLGSPGSPANNPDMTLPFIAGHMTFKERLLSVVVPQIYYQYKYFASQPIRYEIMKKHFGDKVRPPQEILADTDLVLTNTNPFLHNIRSMGPNIIPFGGGVHIMPPKPLPKDIKDYLDSAREGCIYFSLGTNSKSMYMGDQKIQIIMDTLSELPYKVLWKFENEAQIKPPRNVKLLTWAPQQDILRHPNVKLFISQGGIQSIEESVINHVPMVMLPMYGDQEANAKRMEHRGLARIVPHKPIPNKEEFKSIILDVINDPKYKEKVMKTAELLMDQPMGGVEKAVWWIEYVLRHKGAKHLRSPAADIPTYQYYCLDVIGTILLFALMVSYIIYKTISFVFRLIKKLFSRSKTVSNKKKKH